MADDLIGQIDALLAQQVQAGSPVIGLHLSEDDRPAVEDFNRRYPAGAGASGERPVGDDRPRYHQVPIAPSGRAFSFVEFLGWDNGQPKPAFIPLDAPDRVFFTEPPFERETSLLGGVTYYDQPEFERVMQFRAGMMAAARDGTAPQTLFGGGSIEPFTIETEAEADQYLRDLLDKPQYRSMEEVERRAERYIRDESLSRYFIDKAREVISAPQSLAATAIGVAAGVAEVTGISPVTAVGTVGGSGRGGYGQGAYGGSPPEVGTAPVFSTSQLADSDGNPITDSDGSPLEPRVAEVTNATGPIIADVVQPPEIPDASGPAALDFVLQEGRITLSKEAVPADTRPAVIAAMLSMLRQSLANLVHDLEDGTNASPRLISRLKRLLARFPTAPLDLEAVFGLGHEGDVLRSFLAKLDPGELDGSLRADVETLADRLADLAAQHPDWRAFVRNARAAELSAEQMHVAPLAARALVGQMETPEGRQIVDPSVSAGFNELIEACELVATPDDPTGEIKAGYDLLAVDLVDGIDKFLRFAGRHVFHGFKVVLTEAAIAWMFRTLFEKAVPVGGGGVMLWSYLVNVYPNTFTSLGPFVEYLRQLLTPRLGG